MQEKKNFFFLEIGKYQAKFLFANWFKKKNAQYYNLRDQATHNI